MIEPRGETDTLFVEPWEVVMDDGCVALTEPMELEVALDLLDVMKAEREAEQPGSRARLSFN